MNAAELIERGLEPQELELLKMLGGLAERRGVGFFLVGGAVRDLLSAGHGPDLDLVVEGDAVELAEEAAKQLDARIRIHHSFGTATLTTPGGFHVDLVTARAESYPRPGALPVVRPDSIERDLARRDFTINATCISLLPDGFGELSDPFGGKADLEAGVLRVLHDESFIDDPTRILRGLRFKGRFGFDFDPRTEQLLREAISGGALDTISNARVRKEFQHILEEPRRGRIIEECIEYGVGPALAPGFEFSARLLAPVDVVEEAWGTLSALDGELADAEQWLAALGATAVDSPRDAVRALADRLDCGAMEREIIACGVAGHVEEINVLNDDGASAADVASALENMPAEAMIWRYAASGETARRNIERYCGITRLVTLDMSGDDLAGMGFAPSPRFGDALRDVLRQKRNGEISSRAEELEAARKFLKDAVE